MTTDWINIPTQRDGGHVLPEHVIQLQDALGSAEQELTAAEDRRGRTGLCLFADFSDYADGALSGIVPEIGENAWATSGAQLPVVSSGVVSSPGSGYLYTSLDSGSFFLIGGDFSFGGSYGSVPATLAICADDADLLGAFAHCIIGPNGFTLTIRKDGGDFETVLTGDWSARLPLSGDPHRFALMVDGDSIAVFGPQGEVHAATDYRVADALTATPHTAFWQAGSGGATESYLHRAFAFSRDDTRKPSMLDFTDHAIAGVLNTREVNRGGISAGYGEAGGVYVGPNGSGFPSVRWGPRFVVGELWAAMAVSATSFQSNRLILPGCTVAIGIGDNVEEFTTTGFPGEGTAPYTIGVTVAATKAHPSGEGFIATGMGVKEISQNLGDGSLNMPDFVVQNATNYFFGTDYTVQFTRPATDVFGLADGDSFKLQGTWDGGHLQMGSYHLWVDATGDLRIKSSAPSSDTDGTVIGTQS